jgi:uncharacterized membrane protein (UPF0127 family)
MQRLLVDGTPVAPVEVARTHAERSRGLLGRDGVDGALWIHRCRQVHTFRMRFAIDVAHVDRSGRVLAVRTMSPGRLGPLVLRSRAVVETEAGTLQAWGVRVGSTLSVAPDGQR